MPIKKRGGDTKGGAKSSALIRRKTVGSGIQKSGVFSINKGERPKFQLKGEIAEITGLWNKEAPGTIRRLNETIAFQRTSSGILALDLCLVGGFMRSRAGMIYGERSAGKSTLLAKYCATALNQRPDDVAVIVDIEGTVDKSWMARQGVDIERVIIAEPSTGEDAVDQIDAMTRAHEVTFVGIDSIAMLTPFKEIDSSAEDQQIGLQARLIGKMLRRLNNALLQERRRDHHPLVIMLNQFRMKAGLVFGDPRTLPGGKALEFVTSQQLEAKNKEHRIDGSGQHAGIVDYNEHTVVVTKDKTGGRMKEAKFKLIRDDVSTDLPVGYIDQSKTILEYGARVGLVEGQYSVDGIPHKFKSAALFRQYLLENPLEEELICAKIVNAYRTKWDIDL